MSFESVNQFYQEVMQEPALLEKFQSAPDRESLVNLAVEVGQQKGYSFTLDEVEQALAAQNAASETGELSDEQLEAVAGGFLGALFGGLFRGLATRAAGQAPIIEGKTRELEGGDVGVHNLRHVTLI